MRVLAHIHTFNEAGFIEQALEALQRQTRPPDAIVIVDNASTDGTVDRIFPEGVTVIRNPSDLGVSASVGIGFAQALEQEFDWTWLLDADSVPEPDALEKLLGFFERLPPPKREQVCFLACRLAAGSEHRPIILTRSSIEVVPIDADADYCECDCFIWSGSLFRMPAVMKIGLPSVDYYMDLAELEYGYRAQQFGFTGYIVNSSVLHHDVGRLPGFTTHAWRFGPLSLRLLEFSPLRCYYHVRNILYFWLYQCRPYRPRWVFWSIVHAIFYSRSFAVRPFSHGSQLIACLRGAWDGLTGHMERRY
jgi:rhamnopyranosyl-N-acetylglucosaminyl-diphospho-decaprenol beta-1,3/1,4-galactofuranosyltransferase